MLLLAKRLSPTLLSASFILSSSFLTVPSAHAQACSGTIISGTDCVNYTNADTSGAVTVNVSSGNYITNTSNGGIALDNTGTISLLSLSNDGTITNAGNNGDTIVNAGSIISITNSGTISNPENGTTIWNNSSGSMIGTITNSGTISNTGNNSDTIVNAGSITSITNSGIIEYSNNGGGGSAILNNSSGSIGSITNTNSGIITTNVGGGTINNSGSIAEITNYGTISNTNEGNNSAAVFNSGPSSVIGTITNSSTISAGNNGGVIDNEGTINSIVNNSSGVVNNTSSGSKVSGIYNSGTITEITNLGQITAPEGTGNSAGIINEVNPGSGNILTLNNAQGSGTSTTTGALTYRGVLPLNYNIIINSPTSYGSLAYVGQGSAAPGALTFGLYPTSNYNYRGFYANVLSGITSANLNNLTGNYNGFVWNLLTSGGNIWDLNIIGAYTTDTQVSVQNLVRPLQNIYSLQNAVLVNSFMYDCQVFDVNNVCVSVGGRNTSVQSANGLNETSGLLIAAYRPDPNFRIGAYIDQNLSVNNAGSTVNLTNKSPLVGIFGVWSENLDGTGAEIKASIASGKKNTTITRGVVNTSEPGTGSSSLTTQGVQILGKYNFGILDSLLVGPYAGLRYTQNNMGGYTEVASSATVPLSYSALNTNATTALAGIEGRYNYIPAAAVYASAGIESDTNTQNGSINATGIVGLTPVNFNPNPKQTRPVGVLGTYYDIEKNQRIGVTAIYRQESYMPVSTTTVMATFTVGL